MARHRFDALSFMFGMAFLAVAWFSVSRESIDADVGQWLWPAVLIVLGVALLASTFRTGRGRRERDA